MQVYGVLGAGGFLGGGPAPLESVGARFTAPVSMLKTHLRQPPATPAPAAEECQPERSDSFLLAREKTKVEMRELFLELLLFPEGGGIFVGRIQ